MPPLPPPCRPAAEVAFEFCCLYSLRVPAGSSMPVGRSSASQGQLPALTGVSHHISAHRTAESKMRIYPAQHFQYHMSGVKGNPSWLVPLITSPSGHIHRIRSQYALLLPRLPVSADRSASHTASPCPSRCRHSTGDYDACCRPALHS